MKILHVVGARPNFPKLAPVHRAGVARGVEQVVVHTGQHYDELMSSSFFSTLDIPVPDLNLAVGSGSHAVQTARIMERIEPVLLEHDPDWIVVYGDVNSTLAASVVAAKLGLRLAHVEAGLRSDDRSMPEEINRIVTDRLATLLLTPSRDADARLIAEGVDPADIVFVGNVMIDTLVRTVSSLGLSRPETLADDAPILVTLHRPSNVDDLARLTSVLDVLRELARHRRVIFPAHPRTLEQVARLGRSRDGFDLRGPATYPEMLALMMQAQVVITDSGGIQEETTALGIPCLTLRPNTERPITIDEGTNVLVPSVDRLLSLVHEAAGRPTLQRRPEGWDGHAGVRVMNALLGHRAGSSVVRGGAP